MTSETKKMAGILMGALATAVSALFAVAPRPAAANDDCCTMVERECCGLGYASACWMDAEGTCWGECQTDLACRS